MLSRVLEIKLWIKDKKSQEIIELGKKESFEVEWKGGIGEIKKEVVFKKNGKDYQIVAAVLLKKHLLGMRETVARSKFLVPANAPYEIYRGYMGEPNNSSEKDKERQVIIKLTNEWRRGRIIFFLLIIIIIVAILVYVWKVRKRN